MTSQEFEVRITLACLGSVAFLPKEASDSLERGAISWPTSLRQNCANKSYAVTASFFLPVQGSPMERKSGTATHSLGTKRFMQDDSRSSIF